MKRFLIFLAFTLSLLALVSCGGEQNCEHSFISSVTKEPTCTEGGEKVYACINCDYSYREVLAATGHSYTEEVTQPTCTEDGYTTYTCHCGDSYVSDHTDALGHNYIDHEGNPATCYESGWEAYQTCSRCDYNSYVEIPAGHRIENGFCTGCKLPESTPGLEYEKNEDGTYTVTGIGNCQETSISIGIYEDSYVTSIDYEAFRDCSSLKSVTIGNNVTSIGERAFYKCNSLTSVTIGDSVTSIGWSAFSYCTSLTSITIPDSVTSIGNYAFDGCYKLVEVINKSSLNITKGNSRYGSIAYYALYVHKGESKIVTVGDYLFITYDNVNYLLGCKGTATDITLPESYNGKTYEIYKDAFHNCDSLTSVTIPDSVTSIGNYAFDGCDSLASITIPDSVTSIGNWAFYGCDSLASVTFENPDGWWCTEDSSATSGTSISGLSDASTAANYLSSSYYYYYWRRG